MCGELLLASDRGEEQRPLVCLALGCQTPELGRTQKCFFSALLVLHFPIDLRCLLRGHCLSFPPSRLLCSVLQPALSKQCAYRRDRAVRGH